MTRSQQTTEPQATAESQASAEPPATAESQASAEPQAMGRSQFGIRALLYATAFCALGFAFMRVYPELALGIAVAWGMALLGIALIFFFFAVVAAPVIALTQDWQEQSRPAQLRNAAIMFVLVVLFILAVVAACI